MPSPQQVSANNFIESRREFQGRRDIVINEAHACVTVGETKIFQLRSSEKSLANQAIAQAQMMLINF